MSDGGALAELMRWMEPTTLAGLNHRRLPRIRVSLSRVLDLRDPGTVGLTIADVTDDYDYMLTQSIAAAALHQRIEGLIVPATSLVSPNVVVLVDNLCPLPHSIRWTGLIRDCSLIARRSGEASGYHGTPDAA